MSITLEIRVRVYGFISTKSYKSKVKKEKTPYSNTIERGISVRSVILQFAGFKEGDNKKIEIGQGEVDGSDPSVVHVFPQLGHYPRMGAQVGSESIR